MSAKFLLVFLVFLFSTVSFAEDTQLHVRMGLLSGKYTGPENGQFNIPNAFDLEYESFKANNRSLTFRGIIAMELKTSKPFYTYFGSGYRWYFASKGMQVERADENVVVTAVPRARYYFGVDVGISQAIIRSLGRVLQVVSTMVDIGPHIGATYQVDRRLALEAHIGVTTGQGFSSISVIGFSTRALGGFVYHF
jgi:hypothetical protein